MSDDDVKQATARRAREYRARRREADAERARVAAENVTGVMCRAVDAAISSARWLTESDAASVAQARSLARMVDAAEMLGDVRVQLRAHGLLSRVLGEIGLTPRVRMQLELRARKLQAAVADAVIDREPNVTRLKRPEKRPR